LILPTTPTIATPLPVLPLTLMCLVQFVDAFSANSLFAYLGFMVLDFNIVHDASDVGFYSGFVASSFFFCQFLSSFFWGRLSDTYGRKAILIVGLFGSIISNVLFGFSKNLPIAIISRCVNGVMNGNLPVAKTYLGEVTDKSNQASAFSWFATSWGAGIILGPLAGGLLSQTSTKYPKWPSWLLKDFLARFPFLLPNVVCAVISLVILVLIYFYLVETVTASKKSMRKSFKNSFVEIVSDKTAMMCCGIYSLLCFAVIIFTEVFPLWAITEPQYGGLRFGTNDIGIMLGIAGAYGVTMQLLTLKPLAKRFGYSRIFLVAALVMASVVIVFMEIGLLLPDPDASFSKRASFWVACAVCMCINQHFMLASFATMNVMMNNSVPVEKMAAMNGVAMALAALCRAIGPTLGANLFAWTTHVSHFYVISFRTTFYLVAILYICNSIFCFKLPARVNAPYSANVVATKKMKKKILNFV